MVREMDLANICQKAQASSPRSEAGERDVILDRLWEKHGSISLCAWMRQGGKPHRFMIFGESVISEPALAGGKSRAGLPGLVRGAPTFADPPELRKQTDTALRFVFCACYFCHQASTGKWKDGHLSGDGTDDAQTASAYV
jgi:hypothetical protein